MARIKTTAAVHRRIAKRGLRVALQHAGMPLLIDRNYAYFVGIDSRGRRFGLIPVADDTDEDLWIAVHALQTR
jgi:hypothetical protein